MTFGKDNLVVLAKQIAVEYKLKREIVCGQIERESTWNPYELRYEPEFYKKYVQPQLAAGRFTVSEAMARSQSWGLGQIMGQVAREMGLMGPLPQLVIPENGIEYQCRKLAHELELAHGDYQEALQRYNGGGNPNYASEVTALADKYEEG